jgi:hypothetical protein
LVERAGGVISVKRSKKSSYHKGRQGEQLSADWIASRISLLRGQRVILDNDLARIYGVETRVLNQAVKRNLERFPPDFMFQLTAEEFTHTVGLRSQTVILKSGRGRHRKYLPYGFSEHGAIMVANVLNSRRAIQMSIFVVRAFLKMRGILGADDLA